MAQPERRFPLSLERLGAARAAKPTLGLQRPQRPLQEAAAAPVQAAVGHGLDSQTVRAHMVERLRQQGIEDERVLHAMGTVERHRFVDTALVAQAYEDTSLPIGWEQTISKPTVVARMLALLAAAPGAAGSPSSSVR